jgi:hypothetical protein
VAAQVIAAEMIVSLEVPAAITFGLSCFCFAAAALTTAVVTESLQTTITMDAHASSGFCFFLACVETATAASKQSANRLPTGACLHSIKKTDSSYSYLSGKY